MTKPAEIIPLPKQRDQAEANQQLTPLLVSADQAARLCGVSRAAWWRLHAGGLVPAPVRLSGRTLWRRDELAAWVAAGCPGRIEWEARRR